MPLDLFVLYSCARRGIVIKVAISMNIAPYKNGSTASEPIKNALSSIPMGGRRTDADVIQPPNNQKAEIA